MAVASDRLRQTNGSANVIHHIDLCVSMTNGPAGPPEAPEFDRQGRDREHVIDCLDAMSNVLALTLPSSRRKDTQPTPTRSAGTGRVASSSRGTRQRLACALGA